MTFEPLPTVHVLARDPRVARAVEGFARATSSLMHVVADAGALQGIDASMPAQAYVVEQALLPRDDAARSAILGRPRAVLVTDPDQPLSATVDLLGAHPRLCHVLARNVGLLERQLATTLSQALLGERFGLERYLARGAKIETCVLESSDAKQACLDRIAAALEPLAAFPDLEGQVATVASELIMNAIFNAPIDARSGRPRYRDTPRHTHVKLDAREHVTVRFGRDEQLVALSVCDNFGALTRAALASNLARAATVGETQVHMQSAGAGVGLLMTLGSTSQLDVRVTPGRATDVVALVGIGKRVREVEGLGHSLGYFLQDEGTSA